ncbi:MAG: HIT family protein [Candidatus Campbellbacteria bacterium]|nr:HIT family protein [Candidatus Campbellbacteria bacterium]
MNDCIFCKIVKKEFPADIVYEDEHTLAFLDIKPVNKGHTLVVPKEHVVNIFDAEFDTYSHVYRTAKKIALAQKEALDSEGTNISNNNGPAAGQEVFHYHVHVIPRYTNDGLSHWPKKEYAEGEAEEFREKISSKL